MEKRLPYFFLENQPLNNKTYYRMGGHARFFAEPNNIAEIQEALYWTKENSIPCSVLGSGSNSVYADGDFSGLVISLEKLSAWHWENSETLFAEAGVTNTEIAEICLLENRAGAGWMYRMPGQLGASVRMNARCYGGEISQIVTQIFTLDMDGILKTYRNEEVFQGYKKTLLMNKPEIVIGARLSFPQTELPEKLIQFMHECEADRHKKKHFFMPSCGSTFKNNYSIGKPSGQLFDQLGLKGTRVGNAAVSEYHANFVWNLGNATTNDMLSLTAIMRDKAKTELNADLELEVQPVGEFSQKLYTNCGMQMLGPSYRGENNNKWVGLLWHPNSSHIKKPETKKIFPLKIFDSPYIEYAQNSYQGIPSIGIEIIQMMPMSKAIKNANLPFLKWLTYSSESLEKYFLHTPPRKNNKKTNFIDELWKYSVSELFIADAKNSKRYLEFELTVNGNWIALEFDGIRQRSKRSQIPNELLWSGLEIINSDKNNLKNEEKKNSFGMSFSYNQLKKVIGKKDKKILIQGALSLGDTKFLLAPYWKQIKYSKSAAGDIVENEIIPNFHQPSKFWMISLY
ncbi:UDP-N-acetylmuramate dehydrogenase [Fluviispira sanaruensis]|uniref:UDP-N-acetylenolpyruvoylglucosamine reductase n=1 Tax=Fluviispira sanaruensis TaxID=2493639 RepID=A0A4P2VIX8_FLUSA|nr:UDP-N-acetylmuramate dehydrogenase [Fluviispira sanaruensis]BBH52408.1 UDP-N-acetylenolpyruvoylglucosamine reductase [Fluviispira sanaruensis]